MLQAIPPEESSRIVMMEGIMKSILVPGDGSLTSREVRDIANSIAPKKGLTHEDVKAFVAANLSEVEIVKVRGGSGAQYPKYKFKNVRLVSASELAKKAELLLFTITWEEFQAAKVHVKWAREVGFWILWKEKVSSD